MMAMAKLILTKKGDTEALQTLETDKEHKITKDKISQLQRKTTLMTSSMIKNDAKWSQDIQEKKQQLKKRFRESGSGEEVAAVLPEAKTFWSRFMVPKKKMISYKSLNKRIWDMVVLFLAVINGLLVPFEQSFRPEFVHTPLFIILDFGIDLVFVADIILMFYTSILTKKGQETFD